MFKIFKRKKTSTSTISSKKVFKSCVKCSKAFSYDNCSSNEKKKSSKLYCSLKCTLLSFAEPKLIKIKKTSFNFIYNINNSALSGFIKNSYIKIISATKSLINITFIFASKSLLPYIKSLSTNSYKLTVKFLLRTNKLLIILSKNIAFLSSAALLGFISITVITLNAINTNIRSIYHLCKNNSYYFVKWFKPRFAIFIKSLKRELKIESIVFAKFIYKWTITTVITAFEVSIFIFKVCLHALLRVVFKIAYIIFKPSSIFSRAFYFKGKGLSLFTYKYSVITIITAYNVIYIVIETLYKEALKTLVLFSYYSFYIPYIASKNLTALLKFLSIKTQSGLIYASPYVLRFSLIAFYYSLYLSFATLKSLFHIANALIKSTAKASVLLTHLTLAFGSILHDYLESLLKRLRLIPRPIAIASFLSIILLLVTIVNIDHINNFKIKDFKDKFSFDYKKDKDIKEANTKLTKEKEIKYKLAKRIKDLKDQNNIDSIDTSKTEREQIEEYINKHKVDVAYEPDTIAEIKIKKKNLKEKAFTREKKPKKNIITKWSPPDLYRARTDRKELSITFDGGSNASDAKKILRVLRERNIRTTFFITGDFIKKFPKLTKVIASLGHEVGNHTMNHPHLTTFEDNYRQHTLDNVDEAFLRKQLKKTGNLFYELTGKKMAPIWRAPYGEVNNELSLWAYNEGYIHVNWTRDNETRESLDSLDWVSDTSSKLYLSQNEIKNKILKFDKKKEGLKGGIVLMHLGTNRDKKDKAVNILGSMIDYLTNKGYKFTKVTSLMKKDKTYKALLENFTKIALKENIKETVLD